MGLGPGLLGRFCCCSRAHKVTSQVFAAKILCLPQGVGQGRGGGMGCAVRHVRAPLLSHTPFASRAWTSDFPLFSVCLCPRLARPTALPSRFTLMARGDTIRDVWHESLAFRK